MKVERGAMPQPYAPLMIVVETHVEEVILGLLSCISSLPDLFREADFFTSYAITVDDLKRVLQVFYDNCKIVRAKK